MSIRIRLRARWNADLNFGQGKRIALGRNRLPGCGMDDGKARTDNQGIHFASPPIPASGQSRRWWISPYQLMSWCGPFKLFVVPFTEPQVYIRDHGVPVLFTVLMRRSMMRVAEKLSIQYGADALITGESLAQVASQTSRRLSAPTPRRSCQYCVR